MTQQNSNPDSIDRLRAADPAAGTTTDPTLPHVRATLEEIVMSQTEQDTQTTSEAIDPTPAPSPTSTRRLAPWLLAAAVVVVLAGVVGAIANNGDDATTEDDLALQGDAAQDPVTNDGAASADPGAVGNSEVTSCVESYDLDTLGNREYAFDGTVASVDGNDMTFTVNEWFAATTVDGAAETVTLDHQGLAGMLFAPEGPSFEPGTRVLVAGDGGFVWSCGFTQLHDAGVADEWRSALG